MAFELVHSGTFTVDPSDWVLEDVSDPRPYMAVLNLADLATATVRIWWTLQFDAGTVTVAHSGDVVVGSAEGFLTPIVPVAQRGILNFTLVSGVSSGDLSWDLFGL